MILTDIDLIPYARTEFASDDFHNVRYGLVVDFGDVSLLLSRENDSVVEGSVFENGNWHAVCERELAIYSRLLQVANKLGREAYGKWLRSNGRRTSDGKWDFNIEVFVRKKAATNEPNRRNG